MHFYKSYSGLGGYLGVIRTVINIWKSMLIKSKKLIKNKRREINKMIESFNIKKLKFIKHTYH